MRLAMFAYDFPHRKSQDLLLRGWVEGFDMRCILAAPHVDLGTPSLPSPVRTKPQGRAGLVHPRRWAARMGVRYYSVPHSSDEALSLLRTHEIELGVIAGARILKAPVIDSLPIGIVNFHPGAIPEARGLDSLKWAILEGIRPEVTAHLIDQRVDAGRILTSIPVPIRADDSLVDIGLRMEEIQGDVMVESVRRLEAEPDPRHYAPIGEVGKTRGPMAQALEVKMQAAFPAWRERWSSP